MGTPLYRVDTRKSQSDNNPGHYLHDSIKNRVKMDTDGGFLEIQNLMESDSGNYRCRVDFNFYRSTDNKMQLQVYGE